MMCSCCAAPVAVGLRQRAASTTSTLAYWLANPALNPVVLVFCAFVLPWPWTVLRATAGLLVVVGAVALSARLTGDEDVSGVPPQTLDVRNRTPITADADATDGRTLPRRFVGALASLTVRLLPEYLLLVVALGALRGVLFPLGSPLVSGTTTTVLVVGVVVLAVAGTLLPIPTGAEVAIIAAMLAVGVSGPVAAALLVTLPVLSLPSLLMVRRVFPRRVLAGATGLVVVVGLLTSTAAWGVGL
jgi:uncharacterized membrane protein YraQ (UPF0718 family)